MAKVYLEDATLTDIGNSIREKTGGEELLFPSEMSNAIKTIQSGEDVSVNFKTKLAPVPVVPNSGVSSIEPSWYTLVKKIKIDNGYASANINTQWNGGYFSKFYGEEIDIPNLELGPSTTAQNMFYSNYALTTLKMEGVNFEKIINISNMFYKTISLENMIFCDNLGKGYKQKSNNYNYYTLDLSAAANLTHASIIDIFNKLYDLNLTYNTANGGTLYTQQLILNIDCQPLLSEQEIAIATNKGWTVLFQD